MVTHYPQPIAPLGDMEAAGAPDGIVTRTLHRVRQTICGLHGHDNLMQFEKDRLFLQCASCGHESPGWTLDDAPPPVRLLGNDARIQAVVPHFMDVRRIA
jgi:hypothetical protein